MDRPARQRGGGDPGDTPALDARVRALLDQGDLAGAIDLAIRGVHARVIRYIRSVVRDEDLAGEAYSELAEDLCRGLPGFRWQASLLTWCFRLAHHACLRVKDDAWRRRRVPLSRGPASRLAESLRIADTPARLEGHARRLERLRARLTVEEQSLLALRVDQELAWAEIALVFHENGDDVHVNALQKRWQRLREKLSALHREDGEEDGEE
jgi:RNA polymerase sigma-70 factor (ECF subfamily)